MKTISYMFWRGPPAISLSSIFITIPILHTLENTRNVEFLNATCPTPDCVAFPMQIRALFEQRRKPVMLFRSKPESSSGKNRDHVYLTRDNEINLLLAYEYVTKLDRNFSHPAPDEPYNLLQLSKPWLHSWGITATLLKPFKDDVTHV